MKVGVDFDGTISEDLRAFRGVFLSFLDLGHEVVIVTWRKPDADNRDIEEFFNLLGFKVPVIYCSGRAKRECYPADIWIEDNPAAVLFSLTRAPRFEADPRNYKDDVLVNETKGFKPLFMSWDQLRSKPLK